MKIGIPSLLRGGLALALFCAWPRLANAEGESPLVSSAEIDPTLPKGTVVVQVVDGQGHPTPKRALDVAILSSSIAKGDTHRSLTIQANDDGRAVLSSLETGSAISYRVSSSERGGKFSTPPFRLNETAGVQATLVVWPVTNDIESTLVVMQGLAYVEVKDDRVQVQQAYSIYNVGRNAWIPSEFILPLPPSFTAFRADESMSDVAVESVDGKGVRLRGTFEPGKHVLEFSWQVPYAREPNVHLEIGLPPHLAGMQILAPAGGGTKLAVDGFPEAQVTRDGRGQRALGTERILTRDAPLRTLSIHVTGLPSDGPGRLLATVVAAGLLVLGVGFAWKLRPRTTRPDESALRAALLEEAERLEVAVKTGQVGPSTYEKERRRLVEALAESFEKDAPRARPLAAKSTAELAPR